MRQLLILAALSALDLTAFAAEGRVQLVGPTTINNSGSYILQTNITSATGPALTINAGNVELNLNGFTARTTNPLSMAIVVNGGNVTIRDGRVYGGTDGIFSQGRGELRLHDLIIGMTNLANIEVRNATYLEVLRCVLEGPVILNNFGILYGVLPALGSGHARIEDNTVIGFDNDGIHLDNVQNAMVRRNILQGSLSAGGTTIYVDGNGAIAEDNISRTMDTGAIDMVGSGVLVRDNVSDDCLGGISVSDHSVMRGNLLQGFAITGSLLGVGGSYNLVEDNNSSDAGIGCGLLLGFASSNNAYRNNLYRNNTGGAVCDNGVGNTNAGGNLP